MPHYINRKYRTTDRDPNNESIFILEPCAQGQHNHGYRYNVNHNQIRQYYDDYMMKSNRLGKREEFEYLLDRYLFPNGLPDDERRRREVYSIIMPAMKAARS